MKTFFFKLFIISCLFSTVAGWGAEVPLFGSVINITENDTLNVREKPDYHSKKIGYLPLDAIVGIDTCKKVGRGRWCKVFHLGLRDYDGFEYGAKPGWVNAKYLGSGSNGYVIIDGKPNCDYALRCQKRKCEVVESYESDEHLNVTSIKTKWIDRNRLKASTNFGAMGEDPEGDYCTNATYIDEYLMLKALRSKYDDPAYQKAVDFIKDFDVTLPEKISKYIHDNIGLWISYQTYFNKKSRLFTNHEIYEMKWSRNQVLFWGHPEGKEGVIYKSLYAVMKSMPLSVSEISQVKPLTSLRGFSCPKHRQCKGYDFLYIDEDSNIKEHDWQGLVVILEKYRGQWYVAGLLRDRWMI